MSQSGGNSSTPRAVIHKRILDAAGSEPTASMEEIAQEIAGASTDLVERVLEQYGDPVGGEQETLGSTSTEDRNGRNGRTESAPAEDTPERDAPSNEERRSDEDRTELSGKQAKALRLVQENPGASQGDIAEEFDVTRATISRWLNDIPGFSWERRRELAPEILESSGVREREGSGVRETAERADPEGPEELDALRQKIDALERRIDRPRAHRRTDSPGISLELARKVVHASMKSDLITEEEELELLEKLMG